MIIRDGANYVNTSLQFQPGSARAAIGYTANGSLLLVQLEGDLPTPTTSATADNVTAVSIGYGLGVYQFADLLVELGAGNCKLKFAMLSFTSLSAHTLHTILNAQLLCSQADIADTD
jgi:hypothetical protein